MVINKCQSASYGVIITAITSLSRPVQLGRLINHIHELILQFKVHKYIAIASYHNVCLSVTPATQSSLHGSIWDLVYVDGM